jgi:hypothetical protein
MLRAGICDLRTCDLEMAGRSVRPAPASWAAVGLVRPPADGLVRPAKRDNSGHARPAARPVCAQRRVGRRNSAFRLRAADLRRYLPADDDLPHLRPATRRVSRRDAARFRPGVMRFRPGAVAFPPGGCRAFPPECRGVSARRVPRVSPGVPWRFRPGAAVFPPDGGRGLPRVPGAAVPTPPAPEPAAGIPRRVIHFRAAVRDGTDPAVRPAGGQPLTSGPARVRLTRRMTRRSRSIAVR